MKHCFLIVLILCFTNIAYSQSSTIDIPAIKWRFGTDAPIRGGIVSDEKHIYFGNSNGGIFCINKNTGAKVWEYQTGGAITSTPAIENDIVIVVARDNFVYAISKNTGELAWKFQMEAATPHSWGWDYYDASPVIDKEVVLIGSGDHNLYALNINNGVPVWEFTTGDKIRASPLITDNQIYLPSFDGHLYTLNKKNGKLISKFKTEGVDHYGKIYGWDRTSLISRPALKDSLLVFGSRDGGLYCLNTRTDSQKWRFSYGTSWVGSSPIIDGNTVYVGWSDKLLFTAIDLLTGKELWRYDCGAYVYSTPSYDQKNVYVGAFNGKVYGFDKATGQPAWELQSGAPVLSSPLLNNGRLYIGNDAGNLLAIEPESEGEVFKAVYSPEYPKENELTTDKKITEYLEENLYKKLDTLTLPQFMKKRIADKKPSVIVFAFQYLPREVSGTKADRSLLKQYMETGGKVLWLGYYPNFWNTDSELNITGYDPTYAADLLGIKFDVNMDFGTYFAKSTAAGLAWKLPASFNAPGSSISNASDVVPFALNEFGRIAAFWKPFSDNSSGGFVSFCSWSYMPPKQADLETIKAIAEFGLETAVFD